MTKTIYFVLQGDSRYYEIYKHQLNKKGRARIGLVGSELRQELIGKLNAHPINIFHEKRRKGRQSAEVLEAILAPIQSRLVPAGYTIKAQEIPDIIDETNDIGVIIAHRCSINSYLRRQNLPKARVREYYKLEVE